jgi:uncharacterized protein (DUF1697 family)
VGPGAGNVVAVERFAAFLRGMNLGGRRITNEALRGHVEEQGFDEVATFRASGNLILASEGLDETAAAERLEKGLSRALGYEVPVFLRGGEEMRAISARAPFDAALVSASKGKLQVALLRSRPGAAARRRALALSSEDDRLAIEGRELHWLPSGGISESDLDLKALEAALGPYTIRTKGTLDQIVAKHFGD